MELSIGSHDTEQDSLKGVTLSSPQLKRFQLIHALVLLLLPAMGVCTAIVLYLSYGIAPVNLIVFVVFYLLTMLGGSVGYHRLFAHRAFKCSRAVKVLLAILGSMTAQGSPIYWVSNHRRHHEYSDRKGDPHTPYVVERSGWLDKLKGLWFAQVTWTYQHELTNSARYTKDLLRDRDICRVSARYFYWVAIGLVLPAVIGGLYTFTLYGALEGFLWGGLVRVFLSYHATSSINSLSHMIGSRRHNTRDRSTNIWWMSIITVGESFHNNHHAFPASARFGHCWRDIDIGYGFIKILEKCKLVWDVRTPHKKIYTGDRDDE
jgi:stearoyl-CoA desaturase (delta-9 desaturase)